MRLESWDEAAKRAKAEAEAKAVADAEVAAREVERVRAIPPPLPPSRGLDFWKKALVVVAVVIGASVQGLWFVKPGWFRIGSRPKPQRATAPMSPGPEAKSAPTPASPAVGGPAVESLKTVQEIDRSDFKKWVVDVLLKHKVDTEELKHIASVIKKNGRMAYDMIVVDFYLPEGKETKLMWAAVIFNPEMEVFHYGLSPDSEDELRRRLADYPPRRGLAAWLIERDQMLFIVYPHKGEIITDAIGLKGPIYSKSVHGELTGDGMRLPGESLDTYYEILPSGLFKYRDGRLVALAKAPIRSDHVPE